MKSGCLWVTLVMALLSSSVTAKQPSSDMLPAVLDGQSDLRPSLNSAPDANHSRDSLERAEQEKEQSNTAEASEDSSVDSRDTPVPPCVAEENSKTPTIIVIVAQLVELVCQFGDGNEASHINDITERIDQIMELLKGGSLTSDNTEFVSALTKFCDQLKRLLQDVSDTTASWEPTEASGSLFINLVAELPKKQLETLLRYLADQNPAALVKLAGSYVLKCSKEGKAISCVWRKLFNDSPNLLMNEDETARTGSMVETNTEAFMYLVNRGLVPFFFTGDNLENRLRVLAKRRPLPFVMVLQEIWNHEEEWPPMLEKWVCILLVGWLNVLSDVVRDFPKLLISLVKMDVKRFVGLLKVFDSSVVESLATSWEAALRTLISSDSSTFVYLLGYWKIFTNPLQSTLLVLAAQHPELVFRLAPENPHSFAELLSENNEVAESLAPRFEEELKALIKHNFSTAVEIFKELESCFSRQQRPERNPLPSIIHKVLFDHLELFADSSKLPKNS